MVKPSHAATTDLPAWEKSPLSDLLDDLGGLVPCAQDPELWYAESIDEQEEAQEQCSVCPIIKQCREAGRQGREYGIWGGETEVDRARAGCAPPGWRARRRVRGRYGPPPSPCGTDAAWRRHIRSGEPPCPVCEKAHAEFLIAERARYRARRGKRTSAA
ncbi:WhiB family transcriptional regulator [Streptomyces klenkii]|uniref:WhiB family transcriptional regulator n=1 Tax=Streptomyces klenkii TaxID=1420899 RepID=UPI003439486A